jgi:hypothetical protein
MLKKFLFVGALALATVGMSETASADHCHRGYGGYRAPAISYYSSSYGPRYGGYRSYRAPVYRSNYGSPYRSNYGGGYRGYGGYGGYGYGRGTSIGIGRRGVSIGIGF